MPPERLTEKDHQFTGAEELRRLADEIPAPRTSPESSQPIRERAAAELTALSGELKEAMGETRRSQLEWLSQLGDEGFDNLLLRINAKSRALDEATHDFDGEEVVAGSIGGAVPPDQDDKLPLLHELLGKIRLTPVQIEALDDNACDERLRTIAVALPTVVNRLHLFADGNGRSSRFLRTILLNGGATTPEHISKAVTKDVYDRGDATEIEPVADAVYEQIRLMNGTARSILVDDSRVEDEMMDDLPQALAREYDGLSEACIKSLMDIPNRGEAIRLMLKDLRPLKSKESLDEVLELMKESPALQKAFLASDRRVRAQRISTLGDVLSARLDAPLRESDRKQQIEKWVNVARRNTGRPEIDPDSIHSARELQAAYMEAYS